MRFRTGDSVIFSEAAKQILRDEDQVVASSLGIVCHCAYDEDGYVFDVIFEDEGVIVKSIPAEFLMHCGRA
jgi:hypothetical protein